MENNLSSFLAEIELDYKEILSLLKVLKDSVSSDNKTISFFDVSNSLEVAVSKLTNTNANLQKALIELDN